MQHLNLKNADQAERKELGFPESEDEVSLIQETLFQTRTEMTRLRRRLERQESENGALVRQARVLWVITLLVVAGFGASLWYGVREKGSLAASFPAIQSFLSGDGESAPANPIGPKSGSSAESTARAANEAALKLMYGDVTGPKQDSGVQNRPSQSERAGSTEIAPKPERQVSSGSASTLMLEDSVKRARTDFVLPMNKTWEVSPGIFLTVRETSVTNQRIDGWLQIAEDSRTVPIRSQSLQTPATFTTKHDVRKRAVVFTRIDKQQVVGYLLIPLPAG